MIKKIFCLCSLIVFLISCSKDNNQSKSSITGKAPNTFQKGIGFQEDFDHVANEWIYYFTDTVATNLVKFVALDSPVTKYNWSIGVGTYETREIELSFPASFLTSNQQVPIILKIWYTDSLGRDTSRTFTKNLVFFNPCKLKFNGSFTGITDNISGKSAFSIETCAHDSVNKDYYGLRVENLQTNCKRYFSEGPDSYLVGFKQIVFSGAGTGACNSPSGIMRLVKDSLFMDYKSYDSGYFKPPVTHHFKGLNN